MYVQLNIKQTLSLININNRYIYIYIIDKLETKSVNNILLINKLLNS